MPCYAGFTPIIPFLCNTLFGSSIRLLKVSGVFCCLLYSLPSAAKNNCLYETPEGVRSLSPLPLLFPGLSTWLEEAFTVQTELQAPLSLLFYLPHSSTTRAQVPDFTGFLFVSKLERPHEQMQTLDISTSATSCLRFWLTKHPRIV